MARSLPEGVVRRNPDSQRPPESQREVKSSPHSSGVVEVARKTGERRESIRDLRQDQFGEVPDLAGYNRKEIAAVEPGDERLPRAVEERQAIDRLIKHLEASGYDAADPEAKGFARDMLFSVVDGLVAEKLISDKQQEAVKFYTAVGTEISSRKHIDGIMQMTDPVSGKVERLFLTVSRHPDDVASGMIPIGEAPDPEVDEDLYEEFVEKSSVGITDRFAELLNRDRK
jgi:hypothetical protein